MQAWKFYQCQKIQSTDYKRRKKRESDAIERISTYAQSQCLDHQNQVHWLCLFFILFVGHRWFNILAQWNVLLNFSFRFPRKKIWHTFRQVFPLGIRWNNGIQAYAYAMIVTVSSLEFVRASSISISVRSLKCSSSTSCFRVSLLRARSIRTASPNESIGLCTLSHLSLILAYASLRTNTLSKKALSIQRLNR